MGISYLLASPFSSVLRGVLYILHGVVPSVFHSVFGTIPTLLDILRNLLSLPNLRKNRYYRRTTKGRSSKNENETYLLTSPLRRILRELLRVLLNLVLVFVPFMHGIRSARHARHARGSTQTRIQHAIPTALPLLRVGLL